MIRAKSLGLFLMPQVCDLRKAGIKWIQKKGLPFNPANRVYGRIGIFLLNRSRYMTGKSLKHGCHAQFALARKDLLLECLVLIDPGLPQGAAPPVQTPHPLKRQVWRAGKILGDLAVTHAQTPTHRLPDCLLPGHGQGGIHTVQGHPIDKPLPLVKVPPRQRVAKTTVVQEVTVLRPGRASDLLVHRRQGIWQIHLAATPGHMAVTVVFEIPIQPHGQGHAIIAADNHLSRVSFDLKDILSRLLRDHLKLKGIPVLIGRKQPLQQASCRRHRGIFGVTQRGGPMDKKKAAQYFGVSHHFFLTTAGRAGNTKRKSPPDDTPAGS